MLCELSSKASPACVQAIPGFRQHLSCMFSQQLSLRVCHKIIFSLVLYCSGSISECKLSIQAHGLKCVTTICAVALAKVRLWRFILCARSKGAAIAELKGIFNKHLVWVASTTFFVRFHEYCQVWCIDLEFVVLYSCASEAAFTTALSFLPIPCKLTVQNNMTWLGRSCIHSLCIMARTLADWINLYTIKNLITHSLPILCGYTFSETDIQPTCKKHSMLKQAFGIL